MGHPALLGEPGKEDQHLGLGHLPGVPELMKLDETEDPVGVALYCARGIPMAEQGTAHAVHQSWCARPLRSDIHNYWKTVERLPVGGNQVYLRLKQENA